MKKLVYVKSAKFYNYRVSEDDMLDRLRIPAASVRNDVFQYVDTSDKDIFQYLTENKIIPTIVSSGDIRNNPYYDLDDKFIKIVKSRPDSRTYSVPVPGSGRYNSGSLLPYYITVYDDGNIQFGSSKLLDIHKLKPSTLKSYFYKYGY